jgi:hypothetical protein
LDKAKELQKRKEESVEQNEENEDEDEEEYVSDEEFNELNAELMPHTADRHGELTRFQFLIIRKKTKSRW